MQDQATTVGESGHVMPPGELADELVYGLDGPHTDENTAGAGVQLGHDRIGAGAALVPDLARDRRAPAFGAVVVLAVGDGGHLANDPRNEASGACRKTPLPWSGIALSGYPAGQSIADAERAAGRLPHLRLDRRGRAGQEEGQ